MKAFGCDLKCFVCGKLGFSEMSRLVHTLFAHHDHPALLALEGQLGSFPTICHKCKAKIKNLQSFFQHVHDKHPEYFLEIKLGYGLIGEEDPVIVARSRRPHSIDYERWNMKLEKYIQFSSEFMTKVYFYPSNCATEEVFMSLERIDDQDNNVYVDVGTNENEDVEWIILLTNRSCYFFHKKHISAVFAVIRRRTALKLRELQIPYLDDECRTIELELYGEDWLKWQMDFLKEHSLLADIIRQNENFIIDTNDAGTSVRSIVCAVFHVLSVYHYLHR